MEDVNSKIADFHVRLGRVEEALVQSMEKAKDSPSEDIWELVLALIGIGLCYMGLGLPNHYYQYLFAIIIVLSLYRKAVFPYPSHWSEWVLLLANVILVSMLLKVVIGGGEPRPFSWLSYPSLEGGITSFKLSWQQASIGSWELPLTVIQSFFFLMTLFGVIIGFQMLSGLTSFVLVILALPSLVDFNWDWAMPGMISALTCFYLQKQQSS